MIDGTMLGGIKPLKITLIEDAGGAADLQDKPSPAKPIIKTDTIDDYFNVPTDLDIDINNKLNVIKAYFNSAKNFTPVLKSIELKMGRSNSPEDRVDKVFSYVRSLVKLGNAEFTEDMELDSYDDDIENLMEQEASTTGDYQNLLKFIAGKKELKARSI